MKTREEKLNILNVYAPNDPSENQRFWETIHDNIINLPQPDVLLGDFNIVEDSIDRIPAHPDHTNAVNALRALKSHLNLQDGWRQTNPSDLTFTYAQSARQGMVDRPPCHPHRPRNGIGPRIKT